MLAVGTGLQELFLSLPIHIIFVQQFNGGPYHYSLFTALTSTVYLLCTRHMISFARHLTSSCGVGSKKEVSQKEVA